MFASRKAKLIAATAALGLGALAVPGTAFASNTPDPNGGSNVAGNITIPLTLTLSLNFNAFTLSPNGPTSDPVNTAADGWTANPPGGANNPTGYVTVGTNDGSGYFVQETGPTDFTAGSATPLNDNVVDTYAYTGTGTGTHTYVPLSSAPQTILQNGGASNNLNNQPDAGANYTPNGSDNWVFGGFQLDSTNTVPSNTPAGDFTGTVTFDLWGN